LNKIIKLHNYHLIAHLIFSVNRKWAWCTTKFSKLSRLHV